MRGYLTTYVNFCWGLGQEIGIGVIMSMLDRDDEWSYRIPYALQWMLVSPFPWLGICANSRLLGGLSLSSLASTLPPSRRGGLSGRASSRKRRSRFSV